MGCFTEEAGTMVFAVINLILVLISNLICLVGLGYWITYYFFMDNSGSKKLQTPEAWQQLFIILGVLTACVVTLIFSSLLLNGILKKKPQHLKAYFVFGAFVEVVMLMAFIGNCIEENINPFNQDIYGLIACYVIYSGILLMIYRTLRQYEGKGYGHQRLIAHENC